MNRLRNKAKRIIVDKTGQIIPESYNNKSKRIQIPNTNSKGHYVP